MYARAFPGALALMVLAGCAMLESRLTPAEAQQQVRAAETAFAASMAERDFEAFAEFVDEEAVFFSGPEPLHGKEAVLGWWARYFEGEQAPFSWAPERVEVLESGTLAHSSGPVRTPDGVAVAEFNSIWRRTASGDWRVVFDKGCPLPAAGN